MLQTVTNVRMFQSLKFSSVGTARFHWMRIFEVIMYKHYHCIRQLIYSWEAFSQQHSILGTPVW